MDEREQLVLEVGFKLKESLEYYKSILEKNGLKMMFSCVTHDKYYTKTCLDNLSEAEMKNACIRIRNTYKMNEKEKKKNILKEIKLLLTGYRKIFDTKKMDYQFGNDFMKSRIQLQLIDDIGLVCYYDNPDLYIYPFDKQRRMLIDELNSYGFNFKYDDLGLDKLRTLYYKQEMYSMNQSDQIVSRGKNK